MRKDSGNDPALQLVPASGRSRAWLFALTVVLPLAITLVASGAIAALSLKHVANRWPGLNDLSRKAPWISGTLIMVVGFYMLLHGWSHL